MNSRIFRSITILTLLCLSGCATTNGPSSIFSSQGVIALDSGARGIAGKLVVYENASYLDPTNDSKAKDMRKYGFALIYANCSDYFDTAGNTQKWLIFTRDFVGTAGTIATGVLALTKSSAVSTSAVALTTSSLFAGLDTYTNNFLFASENISAVRTLTSNALSKHRQEVEAQPVPITYDTAILQLYDNQEICTSMKIAALVREAIKAGNVTTSTTQSGAAQPPTASVVAVAPPPPPPLGGAGSGGANSGFYHVTVGVQ